MAGDPESRDDPSRTQSHATESAGRTPAASPEGPVFVGDADDATQVRAGSSNASPAEAHLDDDPWKDIETIDRDEMVTPHGEQASGAPVDADPSDGDPWRDVATANGYSPSTPSEQTASIPPPPPLPPVETTTTSDRPATETPTTDQPGPGGDGGDSEVPVVDGWEDGEPTAPVQGSSTKTILREIIETGLLALLVFLAVRASFQNFKVDGESMMPTLHNNQFMIVNKIEFARVDAGQLSRFIPFLNASPHEKREVFHGPSRGEIVVLVNPKDPAIDLVKRVIGLPGETLQVVNGYVYINNHLLIEPYIKDDRRGHYTGPKITIPAGNYFVMGDNRSNSLDSRSPQVGFIPRELFIGKAMLSYWPLGRFGPAPNASPKLSPTQLAPATAYTDTGAGAS